MFWTIAFMFVTLKVHLKIVNMDTMEQIADKFVVIVQEHPNVIVFLGSVKMVACLDITQHYVI